MTHEHRPHTKKSRKRADAQPRSKLKILAKATKHWQGRFEDKGSQDFLWSTATPPPEFLAFVAALPLRGAALDVGCGAGLLTAYLAREGFTPALGFDIARSAIEIAGREGPADKDKGRSAQFVVAAAPHFPVRSGQFDLVIDRGCLHVMDESLWPEYFKEAVRVLAPGGRLYLIERRGHWERMREKDLSGLEIADFLETSMAIGDNKSLTMVHATLLHPAQDAASGSPLYHR